MVDRRRGGSDSKTTGSRGKAFDEEFTLTQEPLSARERARLAGKNAVGLKVFWAWQADTPVKIGRLFIRDAMREAVEELAYAPELAEPERQLVKLDQDGERIPANPELVRDILRRIETAAVAIADVTAVGRVQQGTDSADRNSGRKLINSDVAVEIGYALRTLGEQRLLLVYNAHFGKLDELPFDVRNRGTAIAYTLAPLAGREELASERAKFAKQLTAAIRQALATAPAVTDTASGTPSSFNKAAYFKSGEILARHGEPEDGEVQYSYGTEMLCFMRLTPSPKLESPVSNEKLLAAAPRAPLLSRRRAKAMYGGNVYGAIRFEPDLHPQIPAGRLAASTQLLSTGELWSIGAALIVHERGDRPSWIKLPYLSSVVFERIYYDHLRRLVAFADQYLSLSPPWHVECGLAGMKGLHLGVTAEEIRGPIERSELILQRSLRTEDYGAMDGILLEFFRSLHDAAGHIRPAHLHGFPPDAPH